MGSSHCSPRSLAEFWGVIGEGRAEMSEGGKKGSIRGRVQERLRKVEGKEGCY